MSLGSLRAGMIEADWSPTDDEGQLVERARHDREAFTILYRRHLRLLSDHVYRRTGDVHAKRLTGVAGELHGVPGHMASPI